jgi:hypothetical protein
MTNTAMQSAIDFRPIPVSLRSSWRRQIAGAVRVWTPHWRPCTRRTRSRERRRCRCAESDEVSLGLPDDRENLNMADVVQCTRQRERGSAGKRDFRDKCRLCLCAERSRQRFRGEQELHLTQGRDSLVTTPTIVPALPGSDTAPRFQHVHHAAVRSLANLPMQRSIRHTIA